MFVVLLAGLTFGAVKFGVPYVQYELAMQTYESGDYAAAAEQFAALGEYKDAAANVRQCQMKQAEELLGEGYTVLMTTLDYPSDSCYAMYRAIVREILTASHREAHIKVYGADSLRFSVYEGDKVYLFNSDYDNKIFATIDYGTEKKEFILYPGELKPVER